MTLVSASALAAALHRRWAVRLPASGKRKLRPAAQQISFACWYYSCL